MEILKKFAQNLSIMLKERKLSQKDFAKLINVSEPCVSKWLLMQREPGMTNIAKITKALKCTFEELID